MWNQIKPAGQLVNQKKIDWIQNYTKKRLERLWKLIKESENEENTAQNLVDENGYDSDDHFFKHKFNVNDKVDVKYNKGGHDRWF